MRSVGLALVGGACTIETDAVGRDCFHGRGVNEVGGACITGWGKSEVGQGLLPWVRQGLGG